MLVALAILSAPAHALQSPMSGPSLELGIGGGVASGGGAGSAHASLGWWFGRYDDEYALGRFTALLATPRVDVGSRGPTLTGLVELRRAMDLFVVAPYWMLAAGPTIAEDGLGVAVRGGGGVKLRRSRTLGLTARLEAGVDVVSARVRPAVVATVGGGWSAPLRKRAPR
ncbi:MAG: hypothetical protein KC656_16865 [Myxococcales bacterium]|nr:hypothetical protein [Myxococcales bacterium]